GGISDDLRQHAREPRADRTAVEAKVEDGREHEAQREEREAEELVLVLRARATRPLLHARRDAWTKRPLLPPSSHARPIRHGAARSFALGAEVDTDRGRRGREYRPCAVAGARDKVLAFAL